MSGTTGGSHALREHGVKRFVFALGGLVFAGALGIAAPRFAKSFDLSVEAATFGLAAIAMVGFGFWLGARLEALKHTSLVDPVTLVGNRRHWDESLEQEVDRAVRSRMPLSVMMLDVDNLKRLNDAHGHVCGDRALKLVGEVLLDTCRSRDIAARFGGDEFVVLLPRTHASEALVVAERIRAEIAKRRSHGGESLDVTVSIGVADLEVLAEPRSELLVESADRALYVAKRGGRDRVEVAEHQRISGVIDLDVARAARQARARNA